MGDSKEKRKRGESPSKSSKEGSGSQPDHLLKESAIDYGLDHVVEGWISGNMKQAEEWMHLAHSYHHMTDDQFKKYRENLK